MLKKTPILIKTLKFGKKSKATEVAWTLLEEKNYLAIQERKVI